MKTNHFFKFALVLFLSFASLFTFAETIKYEAEDATYGGGAEIRDSDPGFSGTGFVRNFADVGQYVEFSITGVAAGAQDVTLYYTTGIAGSLNLYVNGSFVRKEEIPSTGGWSNWQGYAINVTLNAGTNTIRFKRDSDNSGYYYIDYLTVTAGESVPVTGVSLSASTLSVSVNSSSQLTATVAPEGATNNTVEWSSSNTGVATVSASGLVTGISAGNATITVTTVDGGLTATCDVTVTPLMALTHGSIIKKGVPLDEEIAIHGTGTFPENATVDYKIVTVGGKLWANIIGTGYELHFQPWSSQIRLYYPGVDMFELTRYNAPNNVVNNTSTNTTIVTAYPYAAFNQIQVVQSHWDLYYGTEMTDYDVNAPNSGLTGDTEKPLLTSLSIGAQDGTTIPVSCTASDNSGDYFYIVTDVDNNFSFVSFTDNFTVTGLTEGVTYSLSVVAVDFSGNQSSGVTEEEEEIPYVQEGGTAYRWFGNASSDSNSNMVAAPELNDGNLTNDIRLSGSWGENEPNPGFGWYQAAGLIFSNAKTITKVEYINGSFAGQVGGVWDDGSFEEDFKLQTSVDGTTWTDVTGWTLSPAYEYMNTSVSGATFTFTGSATDILGVRVTGKVRMSEDTGSWDVRAREITAFSGSTLTTVSNSVSESNVSLYPNPLSGSTLSIKLPEGATQLSIFDITGKVVYQTQVTKNEYMIDHSAFTSEGIYIVNVMTAKGSKNQKLIVRK